MYYGQFKHLKHLIIIYLLNAYEDAFESGFYGTDDAMLVERIGHKVKMIEGSYNNIKITTKEDLNIGSQILNSID